MEFYVPDWYQQSILKVNYKKLHDSGVKLLLFDLDNTIASFKEKDCSDRIKDLFKMLKEKEMNVVIFSNSPKIRVEAFAKKLDVDFVSNACKPSIKKFLEIMKKYKLDETQVAIIGDQMLTDIRGGNKVGIITVLVDPLTSYDPIWTKFSRKREKRLKEKLRDKGLFKGKYYEQKV